MDYKIIDIREESNKFIAFKKQELKDKLTKCGIDFETDDLKEVELKIKIIEDLFARKNDINFVDIAYSNNMNKPMLTETNIQILLNHLKLDIVYDEIKNNIFLYSEEKKEIELKVALSRLEDEITKLDFQSKNFEVLNRKVNNISFQNKINPVRDYILAGYEEYKDNVLDGDLELDKLFSTIKGNDEDFEINFKLFKTWMLSLVACMFNPDFKSQGALTFTGAQGLGKSTWFSNLVPKELKTYFKEEFALNTSEKDNYMESVQYWIVELSELGRTMKDADKAKSHITKKIDEYRAPYERSSTKHKRITVYGASVDKDEFLKDDVNRRWWTIKINKRFDLIELNHKKLYAELYEMYLMNPMKCHELDWETIQLLNKHNLQFSVSDDCDSLIQNLFDWESHKRYLVPSSDIGNLIDKERINNYRIGLSLKKMGVNFDIKDKKTKQKLWHMPPVRKIKKIQYQLFLEMKYPEIIKEKEYTKIEREGIKNETT